MFILNSFRYILGVFFRSLPDNISWNMCGCVEESELKTLHPHISCGHRYGEGWTHFESTTFIRQKIDWVVAGVECGKWFVCVVWGMLYV